MRQSWPAQAHLTLAAFKVTLPSNIGWCSLHGTPVSSMSAIEYELNLILHLRSRFPFFFLSLK